MIDCPYIPKVHSLYDGELDVDARADLQQHLVACEACTSELADLNSLGPVFVVQFADVRLSKIERARLDLRLEAERSNSRRSNDRVDGQTQGMDWAELARTARTLSAIAASIVLISSIWLFEIPSRHTTAVSPAVVAVSARDSNAIPKSDAVLANAAEMPAWERAALTLRVDPRPEDSRGGAADIGMADARSFDDNSPDGPVADWFVAGLQSSRTIPGVGSPHGYP